MSNHRAKHYSRKFHRNSDGFTSTELCEFTEAQAAEIGAILHPDGLNLTAAIKLCEQWNRIGHYDDVQYTYSVPWVKLKN